MSVSGLKKRKISDVTASHSNGVIPPKHKRKSEDINGLASGKVKKQKTAVTLPSFDSKPPHTNGVQESNVVPEKKSKKDKASTLETESKKEDSKLGPLVSSFRVSEETVGILAKKGIERMFPIQAATYDVIYDGKDVVGQAKTGTGKTLAFALPIIERMKQQTKGKKGPPGRMPQVLVLLPTRELAKQVSEQFELICLNLSCFCVYGGTAYGPQAAAFRRGVDILVGTTGRIKDLLEREMLRLNNVKVIILDEVDEMLNMGFAEHVEQILGTIPALKERITQTGKEEVGEGGGEEDSKTLLPKPSTTPIQTLLFSATMPAWVAGVSKKYLRHDKVKIDLVIKEAVKASHLIQHIAIPVHWTERGSVIGDLISVYGGKDARIIIFTDTKKEANELVMEPCIKQDCQVLHGDIPQASREATLKGFKAGKFKCLIATDVAARGLDIPGVDLVIQCEPPGDHETYIHRAGRTGRAGKTGVAITLYTPKHLWNIQNIERRAGFKFVTRGAPQPEDVFRQSGSQASAQVLKVDESTISNFASQAEELIKARGPLNAVAAALAVLAGQSTPLARRSLLTAQKDWVTVIIKSKGEVRSTSWVWSTIKRYLFPGGGDAADSKVRGLRLTADHHGAVFDIPLADREMVENLKMQGNYTTIQLAKELPEMLVPPNIKPPERKQWSRKGGGGGGERSGRGRGDGGSRGGGGRGRGRGRGRGFRGHG